MQAVSNAYEESMRQVFRNRGYIRGTIGIINADAQNHATVMNGKNSLTYFSNGKRIFNDNLINYLYATAEQDFSKIDGSMYFLPKQSSGMNYYNSGAVTSAIKGSIQITFGELETLDIRGLTIDFGECYPTRFSIETNTTKYDYTNEKQIFVTEDVFDGTTYMIIKPSEMVNGEDRLRIYEMSFGVVDSFGNNEVISCSINEFVSATTETLPSKDVEIIIDNQDEYYNPDNDGSALAYLELGQEVRIAFGYDVRGDGNIEWLPETLTYLKGWNATDTEAQFICTDLFAVMESTYYKGLYRKSGISLYDLAVDVFTDAGMEEEKYYIDPYLKKIIVYNPIPPVKHSEALQIIANAGRCSLYDDRQGRIHLQASFVPDMSIASNGETAYSHVGNILNNKEPKDAYAVHSKDFSIVDGSLFFVPKNGSYKKTGYISDQLSDESGNFQTNPKLTVTLESGFVAYGFKITFREVKPEEFTVNTFYGDSLVQSLKIKPETLTYDTSQRFELFDRMEIEFTKGYPNSRVFVDHIEVGDVTSYHLTRNHFTESPTVSRQEKLKMMNVIMNLYSENGTERKELITEEVELSPSNLTHDVYLNDPAYDFAVQIEENQTVKATIRESSSYRIRLSFSGVTSNVKVKVKILGKEYAVKESKYSVQHNNNGVEMQWNNPLISTNQHAKDLEEWISSFYAGEIEYEIPWRGDPRTDANDLFYMELKNGSERMIRTYENSLSFNGAWSGKMKARAVVLNE